MAATLDRTAPAECDAWADDLAPGTTFAGYRIEAVAGRGGMGVVYKARQLRLNRTVALKMVLAGDWAGPEERVQGSDESDHRGLAAHGQTGDVGVVGRPEPSPEVEAHGARRHERGAALERAAGLLDVSR